MIPTSALGWLVLFLFAVVLGFGIACGQKIFSRLFG